MTKLGFSRTYIAAFLYRFALLLVIPFLQAALFAGEDARKLLSVYGTDIAVVIALCTASVIRYRTGEVIAEKGRICLKRGAFVRTADICTNKGFSSFSISAGLFLRLADAAKVRLVSGSAYQTFYLARKDAECLDETFFYSEKKTGEISSSLLRTVLMSVSFSNALTGLLAAAPFLRRAAAVIGAGQTAALLQEVSPQELLKLAGLSPLLSSVSASFILCFIIGFVTEFFAELGLKLCMYENRMEITKGALTRTRIVFKPDSVAAVVFRQSLVMSLAGLYSAELRINTRGTGRVHVLSAAGRSKCEMLLEKFDSRKAECRRIAPDIRSVTGYVWLPFWVVALSAAGIIVFSKIITVPLLPIVFAVIMGLSVLWFVFRLFAMHRSEISFGNGVMQVRWFSGLNFTRAVFKADKISGVEITRSVFQQRKGLCNIKITLRQRRAVRVRIKHIDYIRAEKLLSDVLASL